MALFYPFKGIKYRKTTSSIIAPPYDVINKTEREKLLEKNDVNIIRITLPDSYDKAKELLDSWLKNGILEFEQECKYYVYTADYEFDGAKKTLKGFLGALKLEEFGGNIKPHEKTLKGPKIDRFNLIVKTNAMFCPIMGLHSSKNKINSIMENTLNKQLPDIDVEFENIRHKVYAIRDSEDIILKELSNENIIIADGHHRYETALMVKKYFNKQGIKSGGFDYIMTLLINAESGGLSLLPIHRLIKSIDNFDEFSDRLNEYFEVKKSKHNSDFTMYHSGEFYSLTFKLERENDLIKKLDVSIFEEYIYKKILNLTEEDIINQKTAGYAHSQKEVIDAVDKKEADIGFILNPMAYKDLAEIARRSLTVPQKSTFFYPKMPSGLVGYLFKSMEGCQNV